jgi:hypothetical protein
MNDTSIGMTLGDLVADKTVRAKLQELREKLGPYYGGPVDPGYHLDPPLGRVPYKPPRPSKFTSKRLRWRRSLPI